jgi:hypothetical protein
VIGQHLRHGDEVPFCQRGTGRRARPGVHSCMIDCACRSASGRTKPLLSLHVLVLNACGLGHGSVLPTPACGRLSRWKGTVNVGSRRFIDNSFRCNLDQNTTSLILLANFERTSAGFLKQVARTADPATQFDDTRSALHPSQCRRAPLRRALAARCDCASAKRPGWRRGWGRLRARANFPMSVSPPAIARN